MAARTTKPKKRLGRPPASDSAGTKRRILDHARAAFAEVGYESATNRELAEEVGVTAGALYHYFGSKVDLYVAVYDDVRELVYGRFEEAAAGADTFLDKFEAVLDAAHELNRQDPTLAAFVGTLRADLRRTPALAKALSADVAKRDKFFVSLIDEGVERGEIPPERRAAVIALVMTFLVGLNDGVSDDNERHLQAVTAIKLAMRGRLLA